jgi:hypothetical protein
MVNGCAACVLQPSFREIFRESGTSKMRLIIFASRELTVQPAEMRHGQSLRKRKTPNIPIGYGNASGR